MAVFYKVYQKMNYEAKINDNWWKVHWEDIKFADRNVKKSTSSLGNLMIFTNLFTFSFFFKLLKSSINRLCSSYFFK